MQNLLSNDCAKIRYLLTLKNKNKKVVTKRSKYFTDTLIVYG